MLHFIRPPHFLFVENCFSDLLSLSPHGSLWTGWASFLVKTLLFFFFFFLYGGETEPQREGVTLSLSQIIQVAKQGLSLGPSNQLCSHREWEHSIWAKKSLLEFYCRNSHHVFSCWTKHTFLWMNELRMLIAAPFRTLHEQEVRCYDGVRVRI